MCEQIMPYTDGLTTPSDMVSFRFSLFHFINVFFLFSLYFPTQEVPKELEAGSCSHCPASLSLFLSLIQRGTDVETRARAHARTLEA